jgi:hypothetical protein
VKAAALAKYLSDIDDLRQSLRPGATRACDEVVLKFLEHEWEPIKLSAAPNLAQLRGLHDIATKLSFADKSFQQSLSDKILQLSETNKVQVLTDAAGAAFGNMEEAARLAEALYCKHKCGMRNLCHPLSPRIHHILVPGTSHVHIEFNTFSTNRQALFWPWECKHFFLALGVQTCVWPLGVQTCLFDSRRVRFGIGSASMFCLAMLRFHVLKSC